MKKYGCPQCHVDITMYATDDDAAKDITTASNTSNEKTRKRKAKVQESSGILQAEQSNIGPRISRKLFKPKLGIKCGCIKCFDQETAKALDQGIALQFQKTCRCKEM